MRPRPLLLLLLLCAAPAAAVASCSLDWVCVERVARPGGTDLEVVNLKPWPLTISLRVEGAGLVADPAPEVTLSLAGHERRRALGVAGAGGVGFRYDWTVGRLDAVHDDSVVYALPHAPDASFRLLQGFGSRFSHTGLEEYAVDFDMPIGTPVHAARGGVVVRAKSQHDQACWRPECGRYANFIVVLHDDGTTGEYYHLMRDGVLVAVGDRVERGQPIGLSGNTGKSTMPHLHFGVYRATAWGKTQSVPFRFDTRRGIVEQPRAGARYHHP